MTSATRTCRLLTLGCKVNQYETQYVKEALEASGYAEADAGQPAELCVVNTCTVTAEGDAKSRQLIRRLHQHNPGAAIVVMGCYATRDPDAVGRLPGVVKVVTDKERVLDELRPFGVTVRPRGISRFDGHQRAFVKVQDGCLLNCSFCIIPHVRPVVRSRPISEIVDEVSRLVAAGYQEVVLTGIHLGHYGIDLSRGKPRAQWTRLWHLLEALGKMPGDFRIRLSSLEAAEARDDLVRALAAQPRVCPHLHLCLQSGSDRILAAMKRRYRSGGFVERCRRIREALDRPAFSTDVIVGFPGETDEDFEATCRLVREVGFSRLHVFSYSPRQGTAAARLADNVPPAVKAERRRCPGAGCTRRRGGGRSGATGERARNVVPLCPGILPRTRARVDSSPCPGARDRCGGRTPRRPGTGGRTSALATAGPARRLCPARRPAAGRLTASGITIGAKHDPEAVTTLRHWEGTQRRVGDRLMVDNYRYIVVERHGNAACVRLIKPRLDEEEVYALFREVLHLGRDNGCPRIVLCLGPQTPECLYSVFLARLISLQRRLNEIGGALKLGQCTSQVIEILEVCALLDYFQLVENPADALAQWGVGPRADGAPPEARSN